MRVTVLDGEQAARLRAQPFTYTELGATRGPTPPGYVGIVRRHRLPAAMPFHVAAEALLGWQVQRRAGLRVAASSPRIEPDAVTLMRLGPVRIPCRVVYVLDEPDRRGFAYGTLPGHPERGEEAFVLRLLPDGGVEFTITAFSRPATALARLGGPLTGLAQRLMTARYLRTLDRGARDRGTPDRHDPSPTYRDPSPTHREDIR